MLESEQHLLENMRCERVVCAVLQTGDGAHLSIAGKNAHPLLLLYVAVVLKYSLSKSKKHLYGTAQL